MIEYNKNSFIKDGKTWFPVMGEFQYSRSDARFWNEGVAKMKALGVDVVASYSFWLHHEEIEGRFNFRGNNNLRKFARIVKDNGLLMCLRIGPWVHGEARNGGFPDWIYSKGYNLRSNDAGYMKKVKEYFTKLFEECDGYLYSQGGPIFAIQVENEYSQWGKQGKDIGDEHINALIAMLKEVGFVVPIYFATGWGQAATGSALPVWGAYCEAPWENSNKELEPMDGYLFSLNPNDEYIGSDTGKKSMKLDISKSQYPYATIELGSGIQVTKIRRPIISGDDVAAMVLCKLGAGVSAIGYYVFHGGMQPIGAMSTMQEYCEDGRNEGGFNCDLPIINYDFQAAISQYGQISSLGKYLKLYNYFAQNFGAELTKMDTILPKDNAVATCDFDNLRYSIRLKGESGFVFFNNYIRHYDLKEREINNFAIKNGAKTVCEINLKLMNKQYGIYPFNMRVGSGLIEKITATPLVVLNNKTYVFWTENKVEMCVSGDIKNDIIILNKEQALDAYKFYYKGMERLFITKAQMYQDNDCLHFDYYNDSDNLVIKVFPDIDFDATFNKINEDELFSVYTKKIKKREIEIQFVKIYETQEYIDYEIVIGGDYKGKNAFLYLNYSGDKVQVFIDGEFVADHFYTGEPYEIGLRNYEFASHLTARVFAMSDKDFVYIEKPPKFIDCIAKSLVSVKIIRQDSVTI